MPRKGPKSRARLAYIAKSNQINSNVEQLDITDDTGNDARCQGSCTCIVMLCEPSDNVRQLLPRHIQRIMENGNKLYSETHATLQKSGELYPDNFLSNDQYPSQFISETHCYNIECYRLHG